VIHRLILHVVGHFQSVWVHALASRCGSGRDVRALLFLILALKFHAEDVSKSPKKCFKARACGKGS
jgi:hypothetical protein